MNCAIYIRVTGDKKEHIKSFKKQREKCINLVSKNRWKIYNFYIDVGSGTKLNNLPGRNRMIADAKNRKFDLLLTKDLTRLTRDRKQLIELKEQIESYGIEIFTLDGAPCII